MPSRMLFALMVLMANLIACQPPDGPPVELGTVINSTVMSDGSVLCVHEHGMSLSEFDADTNRVESSFSLFFQDPQRIVSRWTDQQGVNHEVTTNLPTVNPSIEQIQSAIEKHKRLLTVMQQAWPPQQP